MQHTYSHESEALHVFDAGLQHGFLDGDEQWGAICAKSSTDSMHLVALSSHSDIVRDGLIYWFIIKWFKILWFLQLHKYFHLLAWN